MTVPSPPTPPLTPELIERLERAAQAKNRDALRRASRLAGNPYAVTVYERGGLWASLVGTLPGLPWYNTVFGVTQHRLTGLDEVLDLYRSAGISPRLSVGSADLTPALGAALFDRRFTPVGVGATLYAAAGIPQPQTFSGIQIHELAVGEATDTFRAFVIKEAKGERT